MKKHTRSFLLLLLILVIRSAAVLVHSQHHHHLLGVSPQDEEYYHKSSGGMIKCKDGSKSFKYTQLNDDFCDCSDGSNEPEFSALRPLKPVFVADEMSLGFDPKGFRISDKRKIVRLSNYNYDPGTRNTKVFASGSKSMRINGEDTNMVVDQEAIYDELLGDPDYETDELSCFRGLVLDISYRPINVVCWKRAICLEFMEKADVLEYYDQTVNSPSGSFYIPAVLRVQHLLQVVKRRRHVSMLSRKNILARDNFFCQYCSSTTNLTIDHVLPMSRGGEWNWENLVTACLSCNSKKGQKTPEEANMKLHKAPKAPKDYDIIAIPLTNNAIKMLKMRKGTPEEWLQYLGGPSP